MLTLSPGRYIVHQIHKDLFPPTFCKGGGGWGGHLCIEGPGLSRNSTKFDVVALTEYLVLSYLKLYMWSLVT